MDTTSASLLARVRQLGDVEAWGRFVRTYSPVLHGWARHMGLKHDDATDLVQDVFAVLVQKLPEFDYDSHKRFRGWLWTVTRRRWVERRRRAALPVEHGRDPDDVAAAVAAAPELDEAEFRAYLIQHIVPGLRGNFHESTWRAFWKHVVEGRPVAEVAAEEGLSVASVYKAKLRVTAHLQQALSGLVTDE
jgi:RNA polymerase sigma-70 factor (ECF subfamily)